MERSSGVLMPLSALPSRYGIGTFGKAAYDFIDFLHASGQKFWQLLPLGPVGSGDSPYSSPSTFAGNPYYIDLDVLAEDGLLKRSEITHYRWGSDPEQVDYERLEKNRIPVLRKAFLAGREKYAGELQRFREENRGWLENYALYMSLKDYFGGTAWYEWPEELKRGNRDAKNEYASKLSEEVEFWIFVQYLFYQQWDRLHAYAREKGIGFIGDIPIYVPLDSVDVWSEPWFFQLDSEYKPVRVAGCPPDFFNEDGQLWGNPLYNWDAMRGDGFGWWIRRIGNASRLYDIIRLDHFRGFASYWSVVAGEETAINGYWSKGPGMDLVGVLTSWFRDTRFIAEDLGSLTPDVFDLITASWLPGMKVLQFAFDPKIDSAYLPHNCRENSVMYTGTHDNDTILGWLETLPEEQKKYAADYMHITEDEGWCRGMIRTGMSTVSRLFVVQMQDLLELPAECRTNTPGTAEGNWKWRMKPDAIPETLPAELYEMTKRYRRV